MRRSLRREDGATGERHRGGRAPRVVLLFDVLAAMLARHPEFPGSMYGTPFLLLAVSTGDADVVRYLVNEGAFRAAGNSLSDPDLPLRTALAHRRHEVAAVLVEAGACASCPIEHARIMRTIQDGRAR